MGYNFVTRHKLGDLMTIALTSLGANLTAEDIERLSKYRRYWNFYEGYHWEEIPKTEKPEVTENYCRAFVNKFVAFELGNGFSVKMKPQVEEKVLPFIQETWEDNDKLLLCNELGQSKSVTGDAWLQAAYIPKGSPELYDPYDEHPNGRIRILVVPPNIVFPEYDDGYDKDKLKSVTIMYPIRLDSEGGKLRHIIYKQIWTREYMWEYRGNDLVNVHENKYGVIPFFHVKNIPMVGRNGGLSDLEDLIPLNTELNIKLSDVSEIIDYHSAPITVVYGARIGQLEKGANKVWGGLPKDAKVENLNLDGDLSASISYIERVKLAMHEIGGVPESALGRDRAISNTSGVALQITLMPLIERIKVKHALTAEALIEVNKLIIKIGIEEGILTGVDGIPNRDLYYNEIIFEDTLPKDRLVEIQQIQLEMKMGLCDREEAMKRLGKTDIQKRITEIDDDMNEYPEIYGLITHIEEEAMLAGIQAKKQRATGAGTTKNVMKRKAGVNKAGNASQVNSGLTNSPVKQANTNS